MFHVERKIKTLFKKGFFVFFAVLFFASCITQRHTIEIDEYVLLNDGKAVLGREKGLTCFLFENNQKQVAFQQFIMEKYKIGISDEMYYYVTLEGKRFKVYVYSNDELNKYFDLSQFMVTKAETEVNQVTTVNFLGISVIDEMNEDCLAENSLYQTLVIKYLKDLKFEFNL